MQYSCSEDLVCLLSRVTQQLKTYCTSRGEKQVKSSLPSLPLNQWQPMATCLKLGPQQVNETLLRGVTRRLFFNPGLVATPALSLGPGAMAGEDTHMEVSSSSLDLHDPLDDIWTGLATDSRQLCAQTG
jgi:hypothetical protein